MLEYIKKLITPDMVFFGVPAGPTTAIDLTGKNPNIQCFGTHPNVPVIGECTGRNLLWMDGGLNTWTSPTNLTFWAEVLAGSSTINREATEKIEGDYSCRFDVDASNSAVTIINNGYIILLPSERNKVVVWYKNSAAGKTGSILIRTDPPDFYLSSTATWGSSWNHIILPNSTVWTPFELDFNAHADHSTYRLSLRNAAATSSSIYWDNMSIKKVGPPLINPSVGWVFGGDDYVDLTGLTDAGTSFSFSFWGYSRDNTDPSKYIFDVETGRLVFAWSYGTAGKIAVHDGTWRDFGDSPSTHIWHYVTFALNSATSKMKMFLNGSQYGSELGYTPHSIGGRIALGSYYQKHISFFNGFITLPSLSKGAWSLEQHNNIYLATKGMFAPRA